MKRLLIIVILLWASASFAAEPFQLARMNPYIAGAGSAAACGTSLHEDALGTDLSLWTSETDPNSEGAISGGYYVITHSGDGDDIYITKTLASGVAEGWFQVTFNLSDVTAIAAGTTSHKFALLRNAAGNEKGYLKFLLNGDGNISQLVVVLVNDAFGENTDSLSVSLSPDTDYSIKCHYLHAGDVGNIYCYFNGSGTADPKVEGVDNNTAMPIWQGVSLGAPLTAITAASTWKFKNWEWRTDDCF
ncbi:MAG: hypothetical protein PHV74_13980 [Dehalococcoidia bacterium]|nr:hypothetical protein [Dehalococcoidia bacterium]